jgi:hypothetical protein
MTMPLVVAAQCLKTARKNISQSIVNTGYFAQDFAAFERIMLNPMG